MKKRFFNSNKTSFNPNRLSNSISEYQVEIDINRTPTIYDIGFGITFIIRKQKNANNN